MLGKKCLTSLCVSLKTVTHPETGALTVVADLISLWTRAPAVAAFSSPFVKRIRFPPRCTLIKLLSDKREREHPYEISEPNPLLHCILGVEGQSGAAMGFERRSAWATH